MEIVKQNMKVSDEQLLSLIAQISQPFLIRVELENAKYQADFDFVRSQIFLFYKKVLTDFYSDKVLEK